MAARLTAYLVAFIVGTTVIAGLIVGAQREDGPVDLIVVNGRVYTADGSRTMAEAVAVQGNRILHVGSSREVQRLRRPQTVVVDAKGGAVLPGFNDAHTHLVNGGLSLSRINLSQANTQEEIEELLRAWAAANPDTPWITGRGWYYAPFPGGLPTRQIIDKIVPDRPVFLTSYDGHVGWANSHALRLAGITRRTPNPANGIVVKDVRTGEPTGVLKEAAMRLVSALVPAPTRDEQLTAIRAAINEAHRHGITSVQTASGSPDELALYDELRRQQDLPLRIYAALSADAEVTPDTLARYDALKEKYADDPVLKAGVIKLIADGVVEAYTAAMLEPYANRPSTSGEPRLEAAALDKLIADLDRRGWQVMIHAIGDRAVRMALDGFEALGDLPPGAARERRHRIEHIETIDAADIARFAELGVIASMQPYHSLPDMGGVWSQNIGPDRESRAWMYGSIARSQGRLAFGSDWPVMSMDPILGLHVAVNRTRPEDGLPEGGWLPGERLTLQRAIDAYTRDAAWASFDEHRKGSLEPDMLADIVVLSRDIFALPPDHVTEADVVVTIFDGRVVYRRSASTN
jgi:predicted amidohydrolase YtcJ